MRRLVLIFAAVALLSSCGILSNVFKHKTSESELKESKSTVKKDSAAFNYDKSTITITETVDTTVSTPERKGSVKAKLDLSALQTGLNIYEDEFIALNQIFNPKDSTLQTSYTIKSGKVAVPKKKVTNIQNDKGSSVKTGSESSQSDKEVKKKAEAIVERKPDHTLVITLVIIVIIFLFFVYGGSWLRMLKNKFINTNSTETLLKDSNNT